MKTTITTDDVNFFERVFLCSLNAIMIRDGAECNTANAIGYSFAVAMNATITRKHALSVLRSRLTPNPDYGRPKQSRKQG